MYKLSEFRENMRQAFEHASNGHEVVIERYGQKFQLVALHDKPLPGHQAESSPEGLDWRMDTFKGPILTAEEDEKTSSPNLKPPSVNRKEATHRKLPSVPVPRETPPPITYKPTTNWGA